VGVIFYLESCTVETDCTGAYQRCNYGTCDCEAGYSVRDGECSLSRYRLVICYKRLL